MLPGAVHWNLHGQFPIKLMAALIQPWNDPIKSVQMKLMAIIYCQIHGIPKHWALN